MKVMITGGSRGIGAAIVAAFHAAGHEVGTVSRLEADLAKHHQRFRLVEKVIDTLGGLDVLVNNAGAQAHYPALDYPRTEWLSQIELLLTAPFDLSQQAARYMMRHGGGSIINIASVAGITGTRGVIAYSVAKAGLIEMTKCLSNEWLPYGVTVNAVAPGFIATEMQTVKEGDAMLGRIPAARLGTPHEVAEAVLWLASPAARYVSGITIPVDGGWLAR